MSKYHKINSIFKRDEAGRFMLGAWATPEIAFLAECPWVFREKIDGTNVRVYWDHASKTIRFGGRTDDAQMPTHLLARLQDVFTPERMEFTYPDTSMVLYGEGFGAKIQKGGGKYNPSGCDFILFDVFISDYWLREEDTTDIAAKLGIRRVPLLGHGSLFDGIRIVHDRLLSYVAADPTTVAEGLVCVPAVPLFDRRGDRIITKIKHKDFQDFQ